MINKKSVELSLNFIVILIISIIIFGFGVKFISDLSSQAVEITDIAISELDERIGDVICEGSDRVCIPTDRLTIKRKEFDVFGLKILNVLDSQNFDISVSPVEEYGKIMAIKKDGTKIQSDIPLLVEPSFRSVYIKQNEEAKKAIGVQVPANAVSGTYIFNIEIQTADGEQYSTIQKLYVEVT